MKGPGEIVADQRNLVLVAGGVNDGVGVSAGGALKIFKLVYGYPRAGGRLHQFGVVELGGRGLGLSG